MKLKRMLSLTLIFGIFIACSSSTDSKDDDSTPTPIPEPLPSVTFNGSIKSLISSKCAPCHTGGGSQRNFTVYSTVKSSASSIRNRIERTPGTSGFMPNGKTSKESNLISKMKQWQTDGLLEN